jgi:hydroxymethylpyrimidine/phosphomethylpyrimidine kinase
VPLAIALTIAGSDPSGGAGIQADLKTFHQFGVYGEAVITLLTVQNTRRVSKVVVMTAGLVIEQLEAVLEDIRPGAAKTGALGSAEVVRAIARAAEQFDFPLVVDPVMISKQGASLMAEDARRALLEELMPRAYLITPNTQEASALSGMPVTNLDEMRKAAERLHQLGAQHVLVKGGHSTGSATDVLSAGDGFMEFPAERIDTVHTHGTGCTYSAAITAELSKGLPLQTAVANAKQFITGAIRTNPGLGGGAGPVNHFATRINTSEP